MGTLFPVDIVVNPYLQNATPNSIYILWETDTESSNGLLSFFLGSLLAGLAAIFTPCVFPMIPITISFFMHRSENTNSSPVKSATVYMLGIVLTFTFLGMMLAIILGASGANQLAANPWVNLFIGSLFVYFALSLCRRLSPRQNTKHKYWQMYQALCAELC